MTPTWIAAAVLGIAAPFVWATVWRVPFGFLSVAHVLRASLSTALSTAAFGAMALWAMRALNVNVNAPVMAALVGAALGWVLLWIVARRYREVRALALLCQRALEPDIRDQALAALSQLLEATKETDPERHASLALMATSPLSKAECWPFIRDLLAGIETSALQPRHKAIAAQALATAELQLDNPTGAAHAVSGLTRPADPQVEVWLVAIEAWLDALKSNADAALGRIAGSRDVDDPALRASHRIVRAHAFCARGDEARARQELDRLRQEAGESGLQRVACPKGPASALANRILGAG